MILSTLNKRFEKLNHDILTYGKSSTQLVAVSKTVSADIIQIAYNMGQRIFGENRIEVLEAKARQLPQDIKWHFIGNLQSRKLKAIVKHSTVIHSVDDISKIEKIDELCGELSKKLKFLIQVNISEEVSKSGFSLQEVDQAIKAALSCRHAQCIGLMTMAPFDATDELLHTIFARLRKLRDDIKNKFSIYLPELSMGMSHDYIIALKEGATLIRVGSLIFNDFEISDHNDK
ncbi:MAG: YggS family pyridoxal phosphate-dependent enzyme [Lentisphaeria bacterium]